MKRQKNTVLLSYFHQGNGYLADDYVSSTLQGLFPRSQHIAILSIPVLH